MIKNDKDFLGFAITECIKKNFKVIFVPQKYVEEDNIKSAGFFNGYTKEILLATKKPQRDYFPVFVHEFCHFQQYIEGVSIYSDRLGHDVWDWLNGKEISLKRVEKSIKAYRNLELDCEKRVIQHVNNFGLSIDKVDYIRKANAYIYFYSILIKTRKWQEYPQKLLSTVFPKEFLDIDSYDKVPKLIERILLKDYKKP